ncbi:vacuolar protein sorting protein VPS20 [Acrasis kona]|uniref:Vacuolar protein sorting protein VPS20 n=1 Tax=Acrasis kona TaxID=1008807 RepID=A0AAW2YXB9_9EUKA
MGSLFSRLFHNDKPEKKKNTVTEHDKAVLDLKNQRDKLKQYQKKIQTIMGRETEIAKQLLQENKRDKAKLALSKKKYQETLMQKTDVQLSNLQQLLDTIEFALVEKQFVDGLKAGKDALVSIQNEMGSLEDIEKLMDDSREAMEYQQEISRVVSQSLTVEDEGSVQDELNDLEALLLKDSMPTVPKQDLVVKEPVRVEQVQIEGRSTL